ncbi:MAG TPA: hypothetical protein VLL95_15495 [Phnomibacter sp.]|nr:hypothetical protein [Phnomibacter sp.]
MNNFTPEQLIAFHYNELPLAEQVQIADALASNWALQQKYEVITSATSRLDRAVQKAPAQAVANVVNYAKESLALSAMEN